MSSLRTVRTKEPEGVTITLTPEDGKYENVVFWFHGLGDTADGWASTMPMVHVPNTKYVLPTAKTRPISLNGGYPMPGWSDIYGLGSDDEEDREGFQESYERVMKLVNIELQKGISASRIVLAGFSQGGALSLHAAMRAPHSFAGCIALSSWIPFREDYVSGAMGLKSSLPVLQVHGDADQVVAYQWGLGTHTLLQSTLGDHAQFLTIPVRIPLSVCVFVW